MDCMPGYNPHLRFIHVAINPPQLHDGGSGPRLIDGPGLKYSLVGWCLMLVSILFLLLCGCLCSISLPRGDMC